MATFLYPSKAWFLRQEYMRMFTQIKSKIFGKSIMRPTPPTSDRSAFKISLQVWRDPELLFLALCRAHATQKIFLAISSTDCAFFVYVLFLG